jgi:ribosomal protein S18 acetylase RimI-like enzyme
MLATRTSTPTMVLTADQQDNATDVLARAFAAYPVTRYVLADSGADYQANVRALFAFAWAARVGTGGFHLGVLRRGTLAGVAGITPPESKPWTEALQARRDELTAIIGAEASARFDRFGECAERYRPLGPHFFLGVIGVEPRFRRAGYGRALLDALHAAAEAHPTATGVYLDTEDPANVALYARFGYRVIAHQRLDNLDIWSMWRPNGAR